MLNEFDVLKNHVLDLLQLAEDHLVPQFTGFLSDEEQAKLRPFIKNNPNCIFYSGNTENERNILGIFPKNSDIDYSAFPIKAVCFSVAKDAQISHRDVLGSLMSLGLKRSAIGDIIFNDDMVYIYLSASVFNMVLASLKKIKRNKINLTEISVNNIPAAKSSFKELRFTVASLRIDLVVSTLCGFSRNAALELIKSGYVLINGEIINKAFKTVYENDKITVRKKGKFIIKSTKENTKKGKIILSCLKYI